MKTILKIGYNHFLIGKSVNVNSLLTALHDAVEVDYEFRGDEVVWSHRVADRQHSMVEIKLVKDEHFIDAKKRKAIPAQASPDSHGKDITKPD